MTSKLCKICKKRSVRQQEWKEGEEKEVCLTCLTFRKEVFTTMRVLKKLATEHQLLLMGSFYLYPLKGETERELRKRINSIKFNK